MVDRFAAVLCIIIGVILLGLSPKLDNWVAAIIAGFILLLVGAYFSESSG